MNIRSVIIFRKTFLKKKILCVLTFVDLWISSHCPPNINLLFFLGAIRRQPTKRFDVSCLSGKHFGGLVEMAKWILLHLNKGARTVISLPYCCSHSISQLHVFQFSNAPTASSVSLNLQEVSVHLFSAFARAFLKAVDC